MKGWLQPKHKLFLVARATFIWKSILPLTFWYFPIPTWRMVFSVFNIYSKTKLTTPHGSEKKCPHTARAKSFYVAAKKNRKSYHRQQDMICESFAINKLSLKLISDSTLWSACVCKDDSDWLELNGRFSTVYTHFNIYIYITPFCMENTM